MSLQSLWEKTQDRYDVSVIVPTYNRAQYIEECLDSLLAQTRPVVEVIVVDDGSEDETPVLVRRFGGNVRYVRKENGGKPSAVNLGFTLAKGNLVWLFDDDDVALPDAVEHRIETLMDNPHAGFVYSPHFLGSDGPNGKILKGNLRHVPCYGDDAFFSELLKSCFFSLSSALVRIEVYRAVGGFDAALFSSEDYDMAIRIAHVCSGVFSPEPTFIVRQHSGLRGAKTVRYAEDKRKEVFRKYDQMVGLKIRATVSLGDYLTPRRERMESEVQIRQALLNRMVVMASKACIAEMFDDLGSALGTLDSNRKLDNTEMRTIASAICTDYAYDAYRANWQAFEVRVREVGKLPSGKFAIRALANGFYRLAKSYPGGLSERGLKLRAASRMLLLSYQ